MALPNGRKLCSIDVATLSEAADALEILSSLNYLICMDADDAGKVRRYTGDAENAIKKLGSFLQSLAAKA
jgi:hypothetical protein